MLQLDSLSENIESSNGSSKKSGKRKARLTKILTGITLANENNSEEEG